MAGGWKVDWSSLYRKEDWWALWLGLALFLYAYLGLYLYKDALGVGAQVGHVDRHRQARLGA